MFNAKKICLITGANSGIGKASAIQIAKKGCHVIIACRNPSKSQAALQVIKNKSKSDSIELMHVDMSLQSSVKDLATHIKSNCKVMDLTMSYIKQNKWWGRLPLDFWSTK